MRDGALQREQLGRDVHCAGPARDVGGGLEAEVVVAVAGLGRAGGVDDVELGCDAVGWAEVGFGDEREEGVGVVLDKRGGGGKAVLGEGVPDA